LSEIGVDRDACESNHAVSMLLNNRIARPLDGGWPEDQDKAQWNRKLTCKGSALGEPLLALQSLLRGDPLRPG